LSQRFVILTQFTKFVREKNLEKPHALPRNFLGRTPKKTPFPFSKEIFLSGLLAYSPARGAFVKRTLQFRFTTHAERAKSSVLEIGASLVQ